MAHHAYLVPGPLEDGKEPARTFIKQELGLSLEANPDVIEIQRGLFTIEDARDLSRIAYQTPLQGEMKAIIVIANRIYHEAQNALLKLFEEPPEDTTLFLLVPAEGMIIGTLRSRLALLPDWNPEQGAISESAKEFLFGSREKRSALITTLTNAKDDEDKREARDEALSILDGVERATYSAWQEDKKVGALAEFLGEIEVLRSYILDRSSSLKMILEHLSLSIPNELSR